MNAVHRAILNHVRTIQHPKLAPLAELTDVQIIHRLFANHRGERGMRLTNFGLQVMQGCFQSYDIKVPKDEVQKPTHLVFLDDHTGLPYYCDSSRIVVFEAMLAVKLRLVDGRLSTLVSIGLD